MASEKNIQEKVIFEPLPGDFTFITSGGTRREIKLSRPWQEPLDLLINPSKCPFCSKPQEEIKLAGLPIGWKLLPNPWTPHLKHRLIIPDHCWPAERLQILGGEKAIFEALQIARIATVKDDSETALFVHIGRMAGQNIGHLHWHLMKALARQPFDGSYYSNLIMDSSRVALLRQLKDRNISNYSNYYDYTVIAGGARSGECLILSSKRQDFNSVTISSLAATLSWLINLANRKFRSTEGLAPDFIVTVRISNDHKFRYADYCPILTMWGSPEYVMAPLEGGSFTLPWPHEVTAAYLRE